MNFDLIVQRNFSFDFNELDTEKKIKEIEKANHIHLDGERIVKIENLDLLSTSVTHLYLQNNKIEKIDNIDHLTNLRCLILSNNVIRQIENIRSLKKLQIMDISFNNIEEVNTREIPLSLFSLNVKGNKGLTSKSLSSLKKSFPFLIIIDDCDTEKTVLDASESMKLDSSGILSDVCEILGRSQHRVEQNYQERVHHDKELEDMKERLKDFLHL